MQQYNNIDLLISRFKKAITNNSKEVRFNIDELAGIIGDIERLLLSTHNEKIEYNEMKELINKLINELKNLTEEATDAGSF